MKKIVNLIVFLSAALMFASPVSVHAAEIVQNYPLAIVPGIVGLSYGAFIHIKSIFQNPFVLNAIEVEMWSDFIANNLYRGVEFLKNCFRADQYVLKGKVVHIPQAGSKPNAQKNRAFSGVGATKTKRTDTDVVYALDEFTTDPVVIEDAATVQLSYDKMESVLNDHIGVLSEVILDNILNAWMPSQSTNIIRTTGSAVATHLPASTGTRKAFTLTDFKNARIALNKQKVLRTDRFAIMSEDMWGQLEAELKATPTRDYVTVFDPIEGEIKKLYGFTIVTTPVMPIYDNAGTPVVRAVGAAGAATDNDAVLFYQKNHLELAMGEIKFFETPNSAIDYGDVYSALVRMGGRKRYANETGVIALIQVP